MMTRNPKSIFLLVSLLFAVCNGFGFPSLPNSGNQELQENYVDVVSQDGGFIALTNKSRVDWISGKGKPIKTKTIQEELLTCMTANEQRTIVAGEKGVIYSSSNDSMFRKIESGTTRNINCVTLFRDRIVAGNEGGELRIGNDEVPFVSVQLQLKGNIVSLSAGTSVCYGVSDRGEIIHSADGQNWTVFDFNDVYKGYYKTCTFSKVLVTPNLIAVIGKNTDGLPVLFFTSGGNVWSERPLIYTDEEGFNDQLNDVFINIYYDPSNDQFLLLCANSRLMTIPSCSHCNKLYTVSDNVLTGISGNEHDIILVGDNNFIRLISADYL